MTRLRYSGMLRRVFWYMGTNIWEEQTAYFLRVYMIKLGKWLLIRKTERTWVTEGRSWRSEPTAADQGQQYPIRANSGSAEGSCLSAVSTHANNNPSYRVLFITLQRKEGGLYLAHWTPLIHSKCCRRTKDVEWCFENFSALNVVHKRQRRSI